MSTGESAHRLECNVSVDGRETGLGLTLHPLRRQGEVGGWLVLFADLTQAQARNRSERLSESLGQIGQLTAGLAHELRNSLASLRGYLRLIERDPDDDSVSDYLGEIRHEADHLQRVLEDFLTFARPGTRRLEEVDLEMVLRRAAADPALAGARVELRGPPCPVHLDGDAQLLERAFRNLLHNAVRAHSQSGSSEPVVVQIHEPDGNERDAVLLIEDRGHGISEDLKDRLFVPFATDSEDGVGLGLALSRRILELHGGDLDLADRAKGGGARATIRLPIGAPATHSNAS